MTATDLLPALKNPTEAERQLVDLFSAYNGDENQRRSFDIFALTGLPHRRMEQWKWSDVRQAVTSLQDGSANRPSDISAPDEAISIEFDGQSWSFPDELPEGLGIFPRTGGHDFGQAARLPMGALTAAMTGHEPADTLIIEVSGKVAAPLSITVRGGARSASFGRLVFILREESHLDLFEHYSGGAGLASYLVEFGLAEKAQVSRTILQEASAKDVTAITSTAHLAAEANFEQTTLAFGGKLTRIETHLEHKGENAKAVLNGAYLAASGYHVDFTTHVTHGAESCVTEQLTKGAVADGGRGIFQGKFLVPRTVGQFTDADMQHQALLLDNGAEIFAKPELEIYADDVECEHGNTSGQLDDEALFYMQQRGLPKAEARALLTEAFIVEALEKAQDGIREQLIEATRKFLRREREQA